MCIRDSSDAVGRVFDAVCALVRTLATHDDAVARLPRAPLGGGTLVNVEAP